ncbi:MAG: glycosyltransferase family 2 protein [Prosthecobacter sp.]|uniref:glycosyltransferase family 2 protein n=1 Tax=Prosthecobacter sp. TaxID=1965333 RepID=UPI0019FCEDE8|nr:glycosyltransferase family A protein [Prosthecobacter sp.]MBE2284914.1 glycosyltransferase family 2 protein [Prosthecobacter sp.]
MPLFTVYTPTFNRAHTLHRVFDSLQAQSCRDFEWLVIDDGSTDGTAALMARYQQEATFPLRYLQEPHRGAHHAHNLSLRESRGELWVKLDSDDGCVPQTLERLKNHWESIPLELRDQFSGVTGLCLDQNGTLVGSRFPSDPLDCSAAELEYVHKVRGEKWGCLRLDVLRRFPYPEGVSGNFIPESFIWCQVSKIFKTRHFNEALRIYWMDAPSLVHGRSDPRTNAAGHRLMFKTVLDLESGWFFSAPLRLLRAAVQYSRFAWLSGRGLARQFFELNSLGGRLLWLMALPGGWWLWLRDCAQFPLP